jgi:diguanylate cyclase (GGDEF)-like protein
VSVNSGSADAAVARLAEGIRADAWELALEFVVVGLRDDAIPSLARIGQIGQLGDVPTFILELSRELGDPQPARLRRGSPLAARVHDHAREREALGFAPREIVTEFLILRRVLWRYVSLRSPELDSDELLVVERRLNDTIDQLVTECVVAYFDRATAELAIQARRDPLTQLLNHTAFSEQVEAELQRAKRYAHGLTLLSFDVDDFKAINDTLGHPEGDRVLRAVATVLQGTLRASDIAGRMGGDEFAVLLVETDVESGGTFLSRLYDSFSEKVSKGELPETFGFSPGLAHHPSEGESADALFRLADQRLYESKRAKNLA